VLAIGTRLEHFQKAFRLHDLPAGSVVRIVNEAGVVIADTMEGPDAIGRNLGHVASVARHLAAKEASEVVVWPDSVERITGSSTAHSAPWLVSSGYPRILRLRPWFRASPGAACSAPRPCWRRS